MSENCAHCHGGVPQPVIRKVRGELTEERLAELRERWLAIVTSPSPPRYRYLYKGRWRRALPLPWHTRLRLWCTHKRDGFAIWLCDHGHLDAAETVWRLTGAWRKR